MWAKATLQRWIVRFWRGESYAWELMPRTLALERLRLGDSREFGASPLYEVNSMQAWAIRWDPGESESRGRRRKNSCHVSSFGTINTLNGSEFMLVFQRTSLVPSTHPAVSSHTQWLTSNSNSSPGDRITSGSLCGYLHLCAHTCKLHQKQILKIILLYFNCMCTSVCLHVC